MGTAVEKLSHHSLFDNLNCYTETKDVLNPMFREVDRLKSFDNWPLSFVSPKTLAQAGFYYTNKNDLVRCAFCNIKIMKWQPSDNPMTEHGRWSETCPFVRGLYCGNIPISNNSTSSLYGNCDGKMPCGVEVRPNSFPEWKRLSSSNKFNFVKRAPTHPEYQSLESRLKSFVGWPSSITQKPHQLASAGFYYNGKGDQTICFHCGLGLKDWADDDDPWEQHAKWSSKCEILRKNKGDDYILDVCNRESPVLTPEEIFLLDSSGNKTDPNSVPVNKLSTLNTKSNEVIFKNINAKELNIRKQNSNLCKLCYLKERSILFFPCKHVIVCEDCAPSLTTCLICNKTLEATVKISVSISRNNEA